MKNKGCEKMRSPKLCLWIGVRACRRFKTKQLIRELQHRMHLRVTLTALQNCSRSHQLGLSNHESLIHKSSTIVKTTLQFFPPTEHDRKSVLTCNSDDPNQPCPLLPPLNNTPGQAQFSTKISTGRLCVSWRWGFGPGCEEQDAVLILKFNPTCRAL